MNEDKCYCGSVALSGARTFLRIDGIQWGAAFAFNVVFSIFPIMILLVVFTSFFVQADYAVNHVVGYLSQYFPVGNEMKDLISESIDGVVQSRMYASIIAIVVLIWVAVQCFVTLIMVTNQAEGNPKQGFWVLLLKSISLFGVAFITIFLGILIPVVTTIALGEVQSSAVAWGLLALNVLAPLVGLFVGLTLLMMIAPNKAPTAKKALFIAGITTLILQLAEILFALFMSDLSSSNAVYGTFGGAIATLFWIYVSGCVIILGICYSVDPQSHPGSSHIGNRS